jgi:hypothetical protein
MKNKKLGLFKIFFAALRLCVKTNHRTPGGDAGFQMHTIGTGY